MKLVIPVVTVLVICLMISCSTTSDNTNPKTVAEDFFNVVLDGKQEEAFSHVLPQYRDAFRAALQHGFPPTFPKQADVTIVIKKNSEGKKASAKFHGGEEPHGFDMVFQDNRWWITK